MLCRLDYSKRETSYDNHYTNRRNSCRKSMTYCYTLQRIFFFSNSELYHSACIDISYCNVDLNVYMRSLLCCIIKSQKLISGEE